MKPNSKHVKLYEQQFFHDTCRKADELRDRIMELDESEIHLLRWTNSGRYLAEVLHRDDGQYQDLCPRPMKGI